MALDPTRLSAAIYTAWTGNPAAGFSSPLSPAQQAMIRAQCDAIAAAIITEITTNGTVTVASVSGVQTGPGVSGPGAGTIS